MMTRAMLACALVSVGSASFSSAPSFNVPQVDFGELAGLDSSAATLLLHSMTSLGLVAVTGIPGYSEARTSALSSVGDSCLASGAAKTQSRTLLADGSLRNTAATSTAPGGHAGKLGGGGSNQGMNPETASSYGGETTQQSCDGATATLRALVDLGARTVFRSLDHGLENALEEGGVKGVEARRKRPPTLMQRASSSSSSAAAAAAAGSSGEVLGDGPNIGYTTFAELMGSGEQLEHFHVYSPPPPPPQTASPSSPPDSSSSVSPATRGSLPSWKAALDLHTDSGLLIAMTTGFEEKTMEEEEEEEKSSSGATTTNNNGLFVSLPHGEIVRAAVPDGGLLFMVGEGGQAWIRLNDNNDEGGVTNGGAPLRLRAVPHALVLPWQQQEQKMQEMGAKQQPTEWWRAWHGRMFLPPSDALVSSAPSSSSASSSSSSTAMVPFSDFRAAQIRLVLADHTNQEEEDAHLSPTLGCGLLGTAPLANAAISASAAPAQHQQEQQQPSTSFLRALMDPMDDDGGCGEGEVLCWMQCMEASSLVCGPGTQPECVDTVTNTVVSGEVTCPSGIDFCEPLCAVPLPSGQQEGTAFCSGGGTDMYMDGFNSWLGNGDEKLLCLNLLFSSWTLNRKWKVALACLGTLALAIVSEFLGKLRRLANKARLVRAADRQQQQTMTTTRLAVGSGGNKYNFMGAHGEEEGRVENGSGDGHEKTMLSPWAAACLDDLGMASLYALQVAMGYFLMLIAMTYQAELFCCVILGLSAGHALFSLQEPPSANTDPCCVGREDGFDDNNNGNNNNNNNNNNGGGGGFRWDGGEGHVETKDEQDQLKGVASFYSPKSSVVVAGGQQGAGGSGGTMYHETVRLEVGGMTCSSCVSTVKAALERLPNVRAARVGLPNGSARLLGSAEVDCEGAGLAAPAGLPQELAATVESVGFEARAVVRCA